MRTLAELWPVLLGMSLVTYLTRVGGLGIIGEGKSGMGQMDLLSADRGRNIAGALAHAVSLIAGPIR